MSAFITISAGVVLVEFYLVSYEKQRQSLTELVQTQANLIDAISRFDRQHSDDVNPKGWKYATLSQLVDTYLSHEQLGGTGEITLGKREGDRILFLIRSRQIDPTELQYIPLDSTLAEPMRLALSGKTGTVIGSDYRGINVLAAYAPLKELEWGIVAKVAVSDIRAPLIHVSIICAFISLALITLGAWLFHRIFDPQFHRLETLVLERTRSLEKEISIRQQAEESLRSVISFSSLRRQLAASANQASDIHIALQESIDLLCSHMGWRVGHAYLLTGEENKNVENTDIWYLKNTEHDKSFRDAVNRVFVSDGEGLPDKVIREGKYVIHTNTSHDSDFIWATLCKDFGMSSNLTLPIFTRHKVVAAITFFSDKPITLGKLLMQTLDYFTEQLGRVFERQQIQEQITHMATHDPLTELPSLILGRDRLAQAILMAQRKKCRAGLMFLELDGFKSINDMYGHDAGDHCLKEFGSRLMSKLRETDTIARVGGDEFIIVLTEITNLSDASQIAEKIIELVSVPIGYMGHKLTLGVSIGISLYPDDGFDVSQLLKQADQAMYAVKEHGKNSFRFAQDD